MNNGRDCEHGRRVGNCDSCDLVQAENRIAELEAERDALATENANLKSDIEQRKLIHVGFTNEHQVTSVTEQQLDGYFYPNSDNECYIPLYMLNIHAHRVGPDSEIYKEHCERWKFRKEIAEIRAESIESAVTYLAESIPDKSHESVIFKDRYVYISNRYLREYAAKVRQGGE